MKSNLVFLLFVLVSLNSWHLSARETDGETRTLKFNRFSIKLKPGWQYSVNPKAKAGTDQIRIVNSANDQVLMITVTDLRTDIDFTQAVMSGSRNMVMRAMQNPKLKNCEITGGGNGDCLWGRKGLVTSFDFIDKTDENNSQLLLKLYNMGEIIEKKKWVLFITAFLENNNETEIENIIKSIVIFD
ncbi:MAG TPA: hypothetical protein PLM72_11220 [Spirochaetota bacterium]|nr:hypothetical protein [Spirochaetota bacterium]